MMKKKIMLSMLAIALAAAVIGGATMAWFTDTREVEMSTFTAGNLELSATAGPIVLNVNQNDLSKLLPGDSFTHTVTLTNVGNVPLKWRVRVEGQGTLGNALLFSCNMFPSDEPVTLNQIVQRGVIITNQTIQAMEGSNTHELTFTISFPTNGDPAYSTTYKRATWSGKLVFEATQTTNDTWAGFDKD